LPVQPGPPGLPLQQLITQPGQLDQLGPARLPRAGQARDSCRGMVQIML
jgi:hypothetical protein